MSITELLPAVRSLPKSEQLQLLHFLVDEVSGSARPSAPPVPIFDVWFPEANPSAVAAAVQALAQHQGRQ